MTKDGVPAFEVELRALLTDDQSVRRLQGYCLQHGKFIATDKRFLVDYSTFLEGVSGRTTDIRARSTNGKREIIIKKGSLADVSRQEISLPIEHSTLRQLLTAMGLMGFQKGAAAIRVMHRYELADTEVVIQEVRRYSEPSVVHSYFAEIEIMTDEAGQQSAEAAIRSIYGDVEIEPVATQEWYDYIDLLNREANGVFDFNDPDWLAIGNIDA